MVYAGMDGRDRKGTHAEHGRVVRHAPRLRRHLRLDADLLDLVRAEDDVVVRLGRRREVLCGRPMRCVVSVRVRECE
jgi:hypothetical protein